MKFRATRTMIWEYEPDPDNYGTSDPKKMLKIDQNAVNDDPEGFFSGDLSKDEIIVERIE